METNIILQKTKYQSLDNIPAKDVDNYIKEDGTIYKIMVPSFRKAGNAGKLIQAEAEVKFSRGYDYNGHGWGSHRNYFVVSAEVLNAFLELTAAKEARKTVKKEVDPVEKWAKRLAKLTGISLDEAKEIALEKIEYKEEQVYKVSDRQNERFSIKRQKLINKMLRENPLRYIEDESHANNILSASQRHNETCYERMLETGRSLAEKGEIEREDVKDFARRNYKK